MRLTHLFSIFFLFLSLLISCVGQPIISPETKPAPEHFKIISYNIWLGFRNPKGNYIGCSEEGHQTSLKLAKDFFNEEKPDVAVLTEMRFFTQEEYSKLAASWGHPYAKLQKLEGYPVAISSKYPIEVIEIVKQGYDHGYLHVKTKGVHLIALHLSPRKPYNRMKEAKKIVKAMTPLLEAGENVILAGDFNAESRFDLDWLKNHYVNRNNYKSQALENVRVMDIFYQAGFVDTYASLRPTDERHNTFNSFHVQNPLQRTRIDYILASPGLAQKFVGAKVFEEENSKFNKISDHFPISAWY